MKKILFAVVLASTLAGCAGVNATGKGISYTCIPTDARDRKIGRDSPSHPGDALVVNQ